MSRSEEFDNSRHESLNQNAISKQFLGIVSSADDMPTSAEADELDAKMERAHNAMHKNSERFADALDKVHKVAQTNLSTEFWVRKAYGAVRSVEAAHEVLGNNLIIKAPIPDVPNADYHFCARCGEGFPHLNDVFDPWDIE